MLFFRRFLKNNSGVTVIESAIVLPVFLWFILGIIECGVAFHISSLLNHGANEAARVGKTGNFYGYKTRGELIRQTITKTLGPWPSDKTVLRIATKNHGTFENFDVQGSGTRMGRSGEILTYNISYNWSPITPVFGQIFGANGIVAMKASVLTVNEDF